MNRINSASAMCLFAGALFAAEFLVAGGQVRHGPGVTEVDLTALIFAGSIPGSRQAPAVRGRDGPHVELNVDGPEGSSVSRVKGRWVSQGPLMSIDITVAVCDSKQTASRAAQRFIQGSQALYMPMGPQNKIGDASWMRTKAPPGGLMFVLGRIFVTVNVLGNSAPAEDLTTPLNVPPDDISHSLARGLEWTIRQRPELLARTDTIERLTLEVSGKSAGPAVALTSRNVAFASLSVLEPGGASVKWDAKKNQAIVSYQGRTLELRPFHKDASIDGRQIDLGEAVLFTPDGPVVPVQKVAEALGIKVDVIRSTIRLN